MSKFYFSSIGDIISELFDTDLIDIKRNMSGNLEEIYSNIPCHISYNSTDNPDPTTVDIKPIIQSLNVHLPTWVDIENDDFIVAKKMGNDNDVLAIYSGRCGNPIVSQGRKKVTISMQGTKNEEITPPPVIEEFNNPCEITISFISEGEKIKKDEKIIKEIGTYFGLNAPIIADYDFTFCYVDGIKQTDVNSIELVNNEYQVVYEYQKVSLPTYYRYLIKGLYTKNDGRLANGYHLYKKLPIVSIVENDNSFLIKVKDETIIHDDNGNKYQIDEGTKLVLFPQKIFVKVDIITGIDNGNVNFIASEFEPNNEEMNAYVTEWYDGV